MSSNNATPSAIIAAAAISSSSNLPSTSIPNQGAINLETSSSSLNNAKSGLMGGSNGVAGGGGGINASSTFTGISNIDGIKRGSIADGDGIHENSIGYDGSSSALFPATPSTPLNDQDRLLPIANVSRIMKQAVPANAKISKDAKECSQECVSEFIAFITSEAAERCQTEKRKTVNGEDIVWAMETLGFEQYAHLMKIYLQKFKEVMKIEKIGGGGLGGSSPTISGRRASDGTVDMSFAGLDESEYQE